MTGQSRHLDDLPAIRMVLQRVCRDGGLVNLKLEGREWPFPLLAETETRIVLGVTASQRERFAIQRAATCRPPWWTGDGASRPP